MAKFVLLRIRSISTCKVQLVWWGRSTLCSWVRDRHFGKLSCDQKNDRSFPLVRWTTNRRARHNQSESLLQVNTCSDKRLLLVVTLPVWIIYCFIFYDWLNLYLDTHRLWTHGPCLMPMHPSVPPHPTQFGLITHFYLIYLLARLNTRFQLCKKYN